MTKEAFPSMAFFEALRRRIGAAEDRFKKLGAFDTRFGVRVRQPDGRQALFALAFDAYSCTGIEQVADPPPEGSLDFVLDAPAAVWSTMLASLGPGGEVAADQTINTLTHHDLPIRVEWSDPAGHDKLFRYAESVQQVFNLAAAVAAGG